MAPPRKHDTDHILDVARALVLAEGPRAASVAAIAGRSGAPVGTLYHRFGSRDGLLAATWLRALERFQERATAAGEAHHDDPVEMGVAIAGAALTFAAQDPEDAQLLLAVRRSDLMDDRPDAATHKRLDAMNVPLRDALRQVARGLHGRADARALDAVTRAVVDLPMAAIRRHLPGAEPLPGWLAGDVRDAVRALLISPKGERASQSS